ncbi:PadR family transcriptional regulator [Microterricola pindariensis]|uniref:PadR family transcriptional regulator n=1 Tax=Microterricola pindariensis TaxID=478010 RepID=UPI00193108EE|nr:PadR family transcriptional regulator [Microterricola pindariensis]
MVRKRSQTELAVLGALSLAPMSGYRVRAEILSTLGHFWAESFGQIYPTLARLEAAGLVARDGNALYVLTEPGRLRLVELLREAPESSPPRNGVLLRLFFGRELGIDGCLELFDQMEREVQEKLRALAEIRAELDPGDPDERFALITVSAGEHSGRATLAWIAESRAALTVPPMRPKV